MLKILLISISIALVGCQTAPTSFKTVHPDGRTTVTNQYQSQKTMLANSMADNVNQCIALAKSKFDADQDKLGANGYNFSQGNLSGDQVVALQLAKALENTFMATINSNRDIELARMGIPFSSSGLPACEKLGYSHMVIEKKRINHSTLNNLGGKALKVGLAVFGIYQGTKVALKTIDKLSEPTIDSGDGSTNILGDDNNYQPDNRTNPCLDEGTCVSPVEEAPVEEVVMP